MVFFGDDGLDELTTTTTSTVHELVDGEVRTYHRRPARPRHRPRRRRHARGGDAAANAAHVRAVLAGEKGPHRDIAVLNAAAALVVAGVAVDIAAGVDARARRRSTTAGPRPCSTALVDASTRAKAAEDS